jgi:hypothetical protein
MQLRKSVNKCGQGSESKPHFPVQLVVRCPFPLVDHLLCSSKCFVAFEPSPGLPFLTRPPFTKPEPLDEFESVFVAWPPGCLGSIALGTISSRGVTGSSWFDGFCARVLLLPATLPMRHVRPRQHSLASHY